MSKKCLQRAILQGKKITEATTKGKLPTVKNYSRLHLIKQIYHF